jgi:ATP-dependent DNA helicase
VQPTQPQWLDLAFADRERTEAVVKEALALQPNISANEFRRFLEGRARAIQGIAAFLVANTTFTEEEDAATRVGEFAANTLAYHLADATKREQLLAVFQGIATSILEQTDGPQRAIIRRSPLPPASVAELQAWLAGNVEALAVATVEDRLLDAVSNTILAHARSIRSLSDAHGVPFALAEWVAGRSFATIDNLPVRKREKVRVRGNRATVEDVVALFENGFGYDVAMVVARTARPGAARRTGFASASGEEGPDRKGRRRISGSRLC